MKKRLTALLLLSWVGFSATCAATNHVESLTLDEALALAERQHPQLAEAHALVEAAAGRAQQAGTVPNPELIVSAQQLPLEGGASNQREYVAGVAQPLPLGGRVGQARKTELLEREVRARGLEVTRRDLRKRAHRAFAAALHQEQAFQAQNRIAQAYEKAVTTSKARLDAGDAVPEDLARVEMELARAKVEFMRTDRMRVQALVELKAALGDTGMEIKPLAGSLDVVFEIPTLETLAAALSAQPEALAAEAGLRASQARADLAKAERIPDVKVEALFHRLEAQRENTFDLGLSIPLPLFNRNQGRVREARAEAAAAEARARSTQLGLSVRLHAAHADLTTALANNRALKTEILPRADTVLKSAEARHAAGDIGLNEILPIRREWAAVQLAYLESLRDVMQAWAEVSAFLKSPVVSVR